jgi:protease-4
MFSLFVLIRVVFRWIGRMFRNAIAVLGTLAALVIVLIVLGAVWGVLTDKGIPHKTVLAIDARGGFADAPVPGLFAQPQLSFIDLILALKTATADPRVSGVILRVGEGGIAAAHAQELKQALDAFRAGGEGRFVIAQAASFHAPGIGQYYVASLADEIWLQRTSEMNTVGMLSSTVFLRGVFDKLQVKPLFGQRYEYKNAANVYTETDFTPAHREATTHLIQSVYGTLTADIAAARKMQPGELRGLIDQAPYLTQQALDAKLIDRIGFYDDAEHAARERAGQGSDIMPVADYYEHEGSPYDNPNGNDGTIALVAAEGPIVDGGSTESFLDGRVMGGDTIAGAINDAADNASVKVILLRVSSPGGSALASDVILDALQKAQGRGKKVIVSMGPVAASGGYWVSMYADRIFASPTTITGSIGVLSGKLMVSDTYRMVGLNPAEIGVGANANIHSEFADWTPEQRAKFEAGLDQIYDRFTAAVAEGRKLPLDEVREVAKGRVWTGADAIGLKLVDQLGGLSDALDAAIDVAGLKGAGRINVAIYPKVSAWDVFWGSMSRAATSAERLEAVGDLVDSETGRALLQVFGDTAPAGQEIRAPRETIR